MSRLARAASSGRFLLAGALCLLVAACAGAGYLDPGPNPARIEVDLAARHTTPPTARIIAKYNEPILWDWGLYLKAKGGALRPLGPADGQRLKSLATDSLVRKTVFLAPPGAAGYRLIVEAYKIVPGGDAFRVVGLGSFQRDFDLNLAAGKTMTLKVRLP